MISNTWEYGILNIFMVSNTLKYDMPKTCLMISNTWEYDILNILMTSNTLEYDVSNFFYDI